MKLKDALLLTIFQSLLISCSGIQERVPQEFEFAVYKDQPVFIDEYQYKKEKRKGVKLAEGLTEWYLVDWNGNGTYDEVNIDYYGVRSPFKQRPVLSLLRPENTFSHNGVTYSIEAQTNFKDLKKVDYESQNEITYISSFFPIPLKDGKILEKNILEGYHKTVIYFWATWCAPCIETLQKAQQQQDRLAAEKINFVPIFYQCSLGQVLALNKKMKLDFQPRELNERGAVTFQLRNLPRVFVFDRQGKLISESLSLE